MKAVAKRADKGKRRKRKDMQIFVKTFAGEHVPMDVDGSDTVDKIKAQLPTMALRKDIHILHSLASGRTLSDCNIQNGQTLYAACHLDEIDAPRLFYDDEGDEEEDEEEEEQEKEKEKERERDDEKQNEEENVKKEEDDYDDVKEEEDDDEKEKVDKTGGMPSCVRQH